MTLEKPAPELEADFAGRSYSKAMREVGCLLSQQRYLLS
jgi:hypothetical protein